MALFGRKKDDGPATETVVAPTGLDQDLTMPALRPANKEGASMSQANKPASAPPAQAAAARPGIAPGGLGVPARAAAPAAGAERRTLLVGRGISVSGTIADCERLVVEGRVESQMLEAQELSIGPTG
ncbi:MAG: polymer-forming cytoskeletal protein, partial [Rhodovarius sp.]|nr:polymer-forming cytoskeletal protein [Rhodovarius sp.]